jgi:NMD protein affecting ribosome stability and mRNA decay
MSRKPHEQRVQEGFAPDPRPGADALLYCKGCGQPLNERRKSAGTRHNVTVMMCDSCREIHGNDLAPSPGSPTFCYRCGGPDELFVTNDTWPATYHVCPRCLPERAARYRAGDFEQPTLERS